MKRFCKTLVIALALVAVLVVMLTGCSYKHDAEIVTNGNFETIKDNAVQDWEFFTSAEKGKGEVEYKKLTQGSEEAKLRGVRYAKITTSDYGIAYLFKKVKLYSGQQYAFTVEYNVEKTIKTESGDYDAVGAHFGFLEDNKFLNISVTNQYTQGWVKRTIYFKPITTATYTLVAGIGREALGGATGTVEFDNLSIKAVKEVPAGFNVSKLTYGKAIDQGNAGGIAYTVVLSIFALALVVGGYYLIRKFVAKNQDSNNNPLFDDENNNKPVAAEKTKKSAKEILTSPFAMFIYVILGAFAIRFILLMTTHGMKDNMIELAKIASILAEDGPAKLYGITETNLPTGILYILYLVGAIANLAELAENSMGITMLLRIPNIIADLITCYLIYSLIGKNYNYKHSTIVAGMYALLPAMFTASTTWGMNMSISLMFTVAMVSLMVDKKYIGVSATYACGLLFSNSMLILLPLVVAYQVYYCVKDKKSIIPNVATAIVALIVFYCLSIPFAVNYFAGENASKGIFMVFAKMLENVKSNILVSNSSFSFFAMFGLGSNAASTVMKVMVGLIMVVLAGLGGYMYLKSKNRLDFILLAAMSFIIWSVFGVGSKIENMIMGVVLLMIYSCLKLEKRTFKIFATLSVTTFINAAVLLTNSGYINYIVNENAGFAEFFRLNPLYIIGSLITVIATIYLIWVSFDIMVNQLESEIKPMPQNLVEEFRENFNSQKERVQKLIKRNK